MPRTIALDAYDSLLELLAANLGDVDVADVDTGARVPNEYVVLTGISDGKKDYAAAGGGGLSTQQEMFSIDGEIRVFTGGSKPGERKRIRDRAFAIFYLIDDVIQAHVDLDIDACNWAVLSGYVLQQTVPSAGGRLAVIPFSVTATAYLSR